MRKILIDPVTRIEGHLKIEVVLDKGEVKEARSSGTLFRGFEIILKGRDPRDAVQITQRVCGVCPIAHATASCYALDNAFGIEVNIPPNARIIRNLILGANYLQSHILHFYHLTVLDYIDPSGIKEYEGKDPELLSFKKFLLSGDGSPFLPREKFSSPLSKEENIRLLEHYLKALHIRKLAHEAGALWGGKMPHTVGMVAGGVTQKPGLDRIAEFHWRIKEISEFIENFYIPDILLLREKFPEERETGSAYRNFLSYGAFNLKEEDRSQEERERFFTCGIVEGGKSFRPLKVEDITESVSHSWFEGEKDLYPLDEETIPSPEKEKAYSWLKAPRYRGEPFEVGPVSRIMVTLKGESSPAQKKIKSLLQEYSISEEELSSTLGRHIARALDAKLVADALAEWVLELKVGEPIFYPFNLPEKSQGYGISDAPRGGVGHWIRIQGGKIHNYQLVVPTTWNLGPRDDKDKPGPCEKALEGIKVKDPDNPVEILRVVRSFDPCLACAVHLITPRGKLLRRVRVL